MNYYHRPRFFWIDENWVRLTLVLNLLYACSIVLVLLICVFTYFNPYLIPMGLVLFFSGAGWLILDSSLGLSIPFRNLRVLDEARRSSQLLFSGSILLTILLALMLPENVVYRFWIVALLAISLVSLLVGSALEKIAEERALTEGFVSRDNYWRVRVKDDSDRRLYLLSIGSKAAQIQPEEVRVAYRTLRRASNADLRMLERIVRKICLYRSGFTRGEWTILPTSRPRIFIMYKGDHEGNCFLAGRDVSWIAENPLNSPEYVLERAEKVKRRIPFLKRETTNLRNVFYAGNFAVIELGDITVQVDLHNGEVYRRYFWDDWGEEREKFVCIVPIVEKQIRVGRVLLRPAKSEPLLSEMDWHDAVILSKILNIAQESSPVFDLVKHTQTFK